MTETLVYLADLAGLVADLEHAGNHDTEAIVSEIVHSMGEEAAELAAQYAPKRTGELARSIGYQHGPMETRVYASAPYAAYVEFGTWSHSAIAPRSGTYEIRPRNASALKFTGSDGRVVFAKSVQHPGIRPQPFMGPAANAVTEGLVTSVGNVGVELIVRTR